MVFAANAMIETIRNHLYADDSDLLELEVLLSRYVGEPGFEVIRDYALAQLHASMRAPEGARWDVLVLLLGVVTGHADAPSCESLADLVTSLDHTSALSASPLLVWLGRSGAISPNQLVRVLAEAQLSAGAHGSEALQDAVEATLAVCYCVGEAGAGQDLCAMLRGAPAWGAEARFERHLGAGRRPPAALHGWLYPAVVARLRDGGRAWLWDHARGGEIPFRMLGYSELEAAAVVMMAAASVSELGRAAPLWSDQSRDKIIARWWQESRGFLERCGVEVVPGAFEPVLDPDATLTGHDGTLGLQLMLAYGESLLVAGRSREAFEVAEQVLVAFDHLLGDQSYQRWARSLRRRANP